LSRDIFANIFMPTTVHVPPALLQSVDRRAKALGLSRNRLIVRALERMVSDRSGWAPEFLHRLRSVDPAVAATVDELVDDVKRARRSKPRPPAL
jgi:EAL domain-containing protein (putative c-di-GMP-specific phosphodiesterase class I)